jgi:hypothetical protein
MASTYGTTTDHTAGASIIESIRPPADHRYALPDSKRLVRHRVIFT